MLLLLYIVNCSRWKNFTVFTDSLATVSFFLVKPLPKLLPSLFPCETTIELWVFPPYYSLSTTAQNFSNLQYTIAMTNLRRKYITLEQSWRSFNQIINSRNKAQRAKVCLYCLKSNTLVIFSHQITPEGQLPTLTRVNIITKAPAPTNTSELVF